MGPRPCKYAPDCAEPAVAIPRLVFRATVNGPAAVGLVSDAFCQKHVSTSILGDLVDDDRWALILAGFAAANAPAPDRALTGLEWVALWEPAAVVQLERFDREQRLQRAAAAIAAHG